MTCRHNAKLVGKIEEVSARLSGFTSSEIADANRFQAAIERQK